MPTSWRCFTPAAPVEPLGPEPQSLNERQGSGAPLAPGVYAWHTAKALDLRDPAALALVPRERMLAWVFAVE